MSDLAGYRGFSTLTEQIHDVQEFSHNPQQRVRTGLASVDLLIEGPAAGEVCTFLGRSFSGKSLVATNIMANNLDLPLIFFSLEMPARQAITRLYATYSRVDHQEVLKQVAEGRLPKFFEDMGAHIPKQIIIDKQIGLGDMGDYVELFTHYYEEPPAAVIVDYLELILGEEGEGNWRTEYTAKQLKFWAKEHNVAVFLLHQTNRTEPVWHPPTQDSARGAGFTESDVVVGLWQPGQDPNLQSFEQASMRDHIHMNVLKNRINGKTAYQPLKFKLEDDLRLVDLSAAWARGNL